MWRRVAVAGFNASLLYIRGADPQRHCRGVANEFTQVDAQVKRARPEKVGGDTNPICWINIRLDPVKESGCPSLLMK